MKEVKAQLGKVFEALNEREPGKFKFPSDTKNLRMCKSKLLLLGVAKKFKARLHLHLKRRYMLKPKVLFL